MGDGRDEVQLVVPAAPEYLRLARMTAAGLASRLGFTYDDVEDLRIAVDELCFVLVGTAGRPGTIALTFWSSVHGAVITTTSGPPLRPHEAEALVRSVAAAALIGLGARDDLVAGRHI